MAKDGTSPKVKNAAGKPKKGAVRHHNPKHKSTLSDNGLLDDLAQRSYYRPSFRTDTTRVRQVANDDVLVKARKHLCDEVGKRVAAIVKGENWPKATRLLVCQYIKSLTLGDGSKPTELATVCAQRVEAIFVELCSKIIVGDDTLPAQRLEWYGPMLERYRSKRSKQKRPTPLSVPRQRDLQPTG